LGVFIATVTRKLSVSLRFRAPLQWEILHEEIHRNGAVLLYSNIALPVITLYIPEKELKKF
jgi:hypothetical protein